MSDWATGTEARHSGGLLRPNAPFFAATLEKNLSTHALMRDSYGGVVTLWATHTVSAASNGFNHTIGVQHRMQRPYTRDIYS
jgi:hypothetical protein